MKLLLKDGIVVSGTSEKKQDVLIAGEKIEAVGETLTCPGAIEVSVHNRYLFPGFIDAHTHFDLSVCNTITADDFASGTRAAVKGGTTTIIDFATQYHGESLVTAYRNWQEKAYHKAFCDFGFHLAISDWNEKISSELIDMMTLGITSFKLYMTYEDMMVSDESLYEILKRLKEIGGIAAVHCENHGIIQALVKEYHSLGESKVVYHKLSRPPIAEAEAVHRLLAIAGLADTPVIIVHVSSHAALLEIQAARERGQKVYVETCPQYLFLDDRVYDLPKMEGAKYVISPPLRSYEDVRTLRQAVWEDKIQIISTDHCSFTMEQKRAGEEDFTKIPGGIPGVENRGMLMYTYEKKYGNNRKDKLCRLLSENPAKLYGLYPKKGCIQPGSDADIVVVDDVANDVIKAAGQESMSDYNPYEGIHINGKIEQVYLRGQLVVDHGKIRIENAGCYIPREGYNL